LIGGGEVWRSIFLRVMWSYIQDNK